MKLLLLSPALIALIFQLLLLDSAAQQIEKIPNDYLNKTFNAAVFLPESYHKSKSRYPVIFLLHGYSGNYLTWSKIVPLQRYADSVEVIFVCPDGNYDSWYIDSPIKPKSKFESYITDRVIPFIDKKYRTIPEAQGRAICGSSMGGHGALTLFCKHQNLFSAASSISGILDLTLFPDNWNIRKVLGKLKDNRILWNRHSFTGTLNLLENSQKPVLIDCGLSDFALEANRTAHKKLDSLNISHQYYERPGTHSHTYVQKVFREHIDFLLRSLRSSN